MKEMGWKYERRNQKKIKEKYKDTSDSDVNEMYKLLAENNSLPKSQKEIQKLFDELDEITRTRSIVDSEYAGVEIK